MQQISRATLLISAALWFFVCLNCACAQSLSSAITLSPEQEKEIHGLANRVLRHMEQVDCQRGSCVILVSNFSGPTGATSKLGISLADELSMQLGASGAQIVNRDSFLGFLAQERIPSHLLADHNAARWLGMRMRANAVVVGEIHEEGSAVHLTVRLLDAHKLEKQNDDTVKHEEKTREEANFNGLNSPAILAPSEKTGDSEKYPYETKLSDPSLEFAHAGTNGVGIPTCGGNRVPGYTNEAQFAHASGTLVTEVLITVDGRLIEPRIARGLPFGLNNSALSTLKSWRCKPALKDGVPVTVLVPVEISFRSF